MKIYHVKCSWVLSAAHCFCEKTPCKDDGAGNLVVDFVPRERVACVVGLNDIALLPRRVLDVYWGPGACQQNILAYLTLSPVPLQQTK